MRVLAALVTLLAVGLIGLAATGTFGPMETGVAPRTQAPSAPPAVATPSGTGAITLTFTEADLTRAARDYTPLTVSGITVTDPRITLEPGRLTLTATGRAFILSGPVVVVATPRVVDGKASANVESATFAGLALPEATKRDIADTFSRTLAANIPAGVRVTAVTVNSGTLVVKALPA